MDQTNRYYFFGNLIRQDNLRKIDQICIPIHFHEKRGFQEILNLIIFVFSTVDN